MSLNQLDVELQTILEFYFALDSFDYHITFGELVEILAQ